MDVSVHDCPPLIQGQLGQAVPLAVPAEGTPVKEAELSFDLPLFALGPTLADGVSMSHFCRKRRKTLRKDRRRRASTRSIFAAGVPSDL